MIECPECHKSMRKHHERLKDRPGTVSWGCRGLCQACWRRLKRNGTLDTLYPPLPTGRPTAGVTACKECDRAIRPGSTTLAEHPGTVRGVEGYCYTCYPLTLNKITPEAIQATTMHLNAYLDWRRPFREKAGTLL